MRFQGRVGEWFDQKGYGFITPAGGGERVFVHISAFPVASGRPFVGAGVAYAVERDSRGRPRAAGVQYVGARPKRVGMRNLHPVHLAIAISFGVIIALLVLTEQLAAPVGLLYAIASCVTLIAYGLDKAAAQAGRSRMRETWLQLMGLLGGWPGALIAQQLFRHKTRKVSFQVTFWLCVAVNNAVMLWLLTPHGKAWIAGAWDAVK